MFIQIFALRMILAFIGYLINVRKVCSSTISQYMSGFRVVHLKHGVFIECAYGTIIDMVRRKTGADVRITRVCTTFNRDLRGTLEFNQMCLDSPRIQGLVHPFKVSQGYDLYCDAMEMIQ